MEVVTNLKATVLVRVPFVAGADNPQAQALRFLTNLIQVGLDLATLDQKWTVNASPDSGVIEIDCNG